MPKDDSGKMVTSSDASVRTVSITNKCNNSCLVCEKNHNLPEKTIEGMLAEIDKIPDREKVIFDGGEPTIRLNILEKLISYAKDAGFKKIQLNTNGRMLFYEDFCDRIISMGVDSFNVKIFGNDSRVHDKITGIIGSFYQTMRGIENLCKRTDNLKLRVLLSKYNFLYIDEILEFCSRNTGTADFSINDGSDDRKVDIVIKCYDVIDILETFHGRKLRGRKKIILNRVKDIFHDLYGFQYSSNRNIFKKTLRHEEHNIISMVENVMEWVKKKKAFPSDIELFLTDKCNLKCLSCGTRTGLRNHGELLKIGRLVDLVRESKELGAKKWTIVGGGEPLCRKDTLIAVMKEIKKCDMIGTLCTNATMFEEDSVNEIVMMGWDNISVSLDGPDRETNDYLRGVKGSYDKVISGIENFNRLKIKNKKKKPMINFEVVLSKKNYSKVWEFFLLAKKLDIKYIEFNPILLRTNECYDLRMDYDDIKNFLRIIRRLGDKIKKTKIESNISNLMDARIVESLNKANRLSIFDKVEHVGRINDFFSLPCFFPWTHITIEADGFVQSCSPVCELKENVENKSLKHVWFSEYFDEIRKRMEKVDIIDMCYQCCTFPYFREAVSECLKEVANESGKR